VPPERVYLARSGTMAPVSMTSPPSGSLRKRLPVAGGWHLAGVLVFAVACYPVVHRFLVLWSDEIWQVDLEVYREAAHSLVLGRPIYDYLTSAPQYLPMTYPPFAALVGTPLLLVPFPVAGWAWTFFQLWLLWITTGMAFRPLLARVAPVSGLLQGIVAGILIQLQPVADGIRFGQVNAVLVALCLADAVRRREGRWPRGSLVGVAAAVKLTPAVFWVHWATVRRWRVLAVSMGTAAALTGLTALLAPASTAAYWTQALLDPGRLGPNAGTSNQSLRGVLLRLGPSQGPLLTLTWLVLVLVVGAGGYWLAARLHRLGEPVGAVAAVGMLAVLLSPVSWVHHLHWGILVIAALLGDARTWSRTLAALVAALVLYLKLPWWGGSMVTEHRGPYWVASLLENSYTLFGVLALVALWFFLARGRAPGDPAQVGTPATDAALVDGAGAPLTPAR
jgi:alpha-1,2-mannosyltransferase